MTEHIALLHMAIAEVADSRSADRGTVGGAIVHADPAGDVGPAVLALDAEMVIAGAGGATPDRGRRGLLHRPLRDGCR